MIWFNNHYKTEQFKVIKLTTYSFQNIDKLFHANINNSISFCC